MKLISISKNSTMKNSIMKNFGIILFITALIIIPLQGCEKNEDVNVILPSTYVVKGQDGYEYVLTDNEFLTPYDLPIRELRIKYGDESSIADWNDLVTNFKDDFPGFLNQIGLSDSENHQSFFITKDGEYQHISSRFYQITGKNNPNSSSWIILKNLDDSRLILTADFDKGKVLVKIPTDQ
jgi:hypothetical protein